MKKSEIKEYIAELKEMLPDSDKEKLNEFEEALNESPTFISFVQWKRDEKKKVDSRKYMRENQEYFNELKDKKEPVSIIGRVDGVTVDKGIIEDFGKNFITLVGGRPIRNISEVVPTSEYLERLVEFPELMTYAKNNTDDYTEQLQLYPRFAKIVYDELNDMLQEGEKPTKRDKKDVISYLINSTEGQAKLNEKITELRKEK